MAELVFEDPGRLYVPRARPEPVQAPQADPWAGMQEIQLGNDNAPAPPISGPQGIPGSDPWAGQPEIDLAAEKQRHIEVGAGEAIGRGLLHGATLGLSPAIEGASAAAEPDIEAAAKKFGLDPETAKKFLNHVAPNLKTIYGAGHVAYDKVTHTGEPTPAQAAYEGARSKEAQANEAAYEEHPYLYTGGNIAGSMAVPLPGTGALKVGATLGPRLLRGAVAGSIGGGAAGGGNAIGEGKSAGGIASDTLSGTLLGGVLGGAFHGAFGPRPKPPGLSPGEQATQTAAEFGAPLPRALSYDSKSAQALGQLAQQTPITGHWITERAQNTLKAAENKIGSMADELSPNTTRASTDKALRGSLENALEFNKRAQNGVFDDLRNVINPDQRRPMPNTLHDLKEIEYARLSAGASPAQARAGLEEAWRLATDPYGGGFNGVHRLRSILRNPPAVIRLTNPGYNAGDFNRVAGAMTKDLHKIVRETSINPKEADRLFTKADKQFGILADENSLLEELRDANKEGGITQLINSIKEKGGFLRQLVTVKKSFPPKDFERITGVIMSELGRNNANQFTFAQFATQWSKMSDAAKALLFSPEHRRNIDKIVQLAEHVKNADKLRNTSNTAGAMIMFDMLHAAVEGGIALAAGVLTGHEAAVTLGGIGAATAFGAFMASPAKVASFSRWMQAYSGLTLNQPTPMRIAAFKIATRNLANTVGIPFDRLMSAIGQVQQGQSNQP
jgi:hypothetical protein